jgi:HD-GYP domain-containing protein (c-di-GMP phosphodiesterase class II)
MPRPYRQALAEDYVIKDMRELSGLRFEPRILEAFLDSLPKIHETRLKYPVA